MKLSLRSGMRHTSGGRLRQVVAMGLLALVHGLPALARDKDKLPYGEGLTVVVPAPQNEVEQVVADVAQNGVIRGTKEYNKDEFVSGAVAASSCRIFPAWTEAGKVFYKVREHAIDPRNFKDGGDVGTLAVRYVVLPQDDKNTVVRIDALFEEDFRKVVHQSSGSVEGAEYNDIHEHLDALEVMKKQNVEAESERQEQLAKKQSQAPQWKDPSAASSTSQTSESPVYSSSKEDLAQPVSKSVPAASIPAQTLEDHVKDLRKQVERLVKSPGAPLKSAPFHTASTMQTLATGTEVLILISTPYWYGIETREGQHGWMMRDQLEQP